MATVFLGYFGFALILGISVGGPLVAGRMLADRELEPDPEILAIEAHALALLAGKIEDQ